MPPILRSSRSFPVRMHSRQGRVRPAAVRPLSVAGALLVGVSLASSAPAGAQAPGILPKATQLPASARAMALGDSYAMSSGHADAVFYHPALLNRSSGFGLEWQRWSAQSSAAAASAAVSWLGGTVGVGLRSMQYGADGGGPLAAPPGQDHLFEFGSVPVSERIATLAYSRDFFFGLDFGVAVDLVDERVGGQVHGVTLFDVGLAGEIGPFTVGLTAHDIGEKPILTAGDAPARWTLGAGAYGRPLGPLDVGLAAHLGLDHEEELTYGGGVEIGYWPIQGRTFVLRLGVQDAPQGGDESHFTTGFAFWGDDLTVEWAFRPVSGADEGGTHRFGVRWR